jgi:hypothetical protein
MDTFTLESGTDKSIIIVRYGDFVYYKTLLRSLDGLLALKKPKRVRLVLDFSEVQSFLVSHHQIINFRKSLMSLFNVKARKIAIINAPKASWGNIVSAHSSSREEGLPRLDLCGFEAHQKRQAYRWA